MAAIGSRSGGGAQVASPPCGLATIFSRSPPTPPSRVSNLMSDFCQWHVFAYCSLLPGAMSPSKAASGFVGRVFFSELEVYLGHRNNVHRNTRARPFNAVLLGRVYRTWGIRDYYVYDTEMRAKAY